MANVDKIRVAMQAQNACNPRPLARLLAEWISEDSVSMVTRREEVPVHIRLLLGQLNFLLGQGLGPELSDFEEADKMIALRYTEVSA